MVHLHFCLIIWEQIREHLRAHNAVPVRCKDTSRVEVFCILMCFTYKCQRTLHVSTKDHSQQENLPYMLWFLFKIILNEGSIILRYFWLRKKLSHTNAMKSLIFRMRKVVCHTDITPLCNQFPESTTPLRWAQVSTLCARTCAWMFHEVAYFVEVRWSVS